MRINHNISALQTNSHMRRTDLSLSRAMERLSSGYKINRAADDAAGMAISRKMRTQVDGLERASMNGSDGISVIQTAEGALNEVTAILQRCRELSVQAANDTNTPEDRNSIQQEINQLIKEIDRVSESTEFNTKTLLNGELANNSYTDVPGVELIYSSDTVPANEYPFKLKMDPRQAVINCDSPYLDEVDETTKGEIKINGVPVYFHEGQTKEEWYSSLRNTCDTIGIEAFFGDGPTEDGPVETAGYEKGDESSGGNLIFMSKGYGSAEKIKITCSNPDLAAALGITADEDGVEAKGIDAEIELDQAAFEKSGFAKTATAFGDGDIVTIKDGDGQEWKYRITPGTVGNNFVDQLGDGTGKPDPEYGDVDVMSTLLNAGSLYLQIGANEDQTMEVKIPRIDSETLGIKYANVCTHDNADRAITLFDKAVNFVSSIRSKLGAYQNRLEHTVTNLDTTNYNLTEAMSRIQDADMAEEMTEFTQQNVLQQAGTAMLAQANERPQSILSLLNG